MSRGGYREGSGRSKNGYYKGIFCNSTYELCWVIYNIDHKIKFERFPTKLEKDGVVYYPDFLLDDKKTIIETKGYEKQESVDRKTKVAESFGYTVIVLRKDDLQYAFDYVEETYKTKKFYELYDNYKPKFVATCNNCLIEFATDKTPKNDLRFCSRTCAGKHRNSINSASAEVKDKISSKLIGKSPAPYKRKYKQMWITDGKVNTRIKENSSIPEGFRKGRTVLL